MASLSMITRASGRLVALVMASALSGCGDDVAGPPNPSVIRLQGTVTEAITRAPIDGAQVILQWPAGAFGTGTEWAETDAEGRYSLERDFGAAVATCEGLGATAQAEGFHPEFVLPGRIRCVSEVQVFDFALERQT